MTSLKQKIYDLAKKIGFLDLRIAEAQPLKSEFKYFLKWLDLGYHADMSWMERNPWKRENINHLLPGAKSVIVTAHSYFTGDEYPDENEMKGSGKISRYAWGDDYHDVILKKQKKLEALLYEYDAKQESKNYVDTGPILERQWAVKSGIGWQGKNGMIIRRDAGSYFFLGIIISTIELEPDKPIKSYCGKCTKCIDACPTGAIIKSKVVDSSRCLSYWTIEYRGDELPDEIKKKLNGWAFGCDICQEVCPWNKFAKLTQEEKFKPRFGKMTVNTDEIMNMSDEKFRDRFCKSAVTRAKLKGLQKNFIP
jgi:epoxyqueuosine reductase